MSHSLYVTIPALIRMMALSLVAVCLASCAPKDKPIQGDKPTQSEKEMVGSGEVTFKALPQPKSEANRYVVALSWSTKRAPGAWTLQRAEQGSRTHHLVTLESSEARFTDERVEAGKTYRYVLGSLQASRYIALQETTITVPHDIGVFEDQKLSGRVGANRLFFTKNDWAITYGEDTDISVDEIISEDGVIATFADARTAPPETDGRPGGKLTIRAKRGRGILHIMARGENGGRGREGALGSTGPKGARGNSGVCQMASSFSLPNWLDELLIPKAYADHSQPEGFIGRTDKTLRCTAQPSDGLQGGAGLSGGNGGKGGKGGDSARVYVEIEDPTDFQVKTWVDVGLGGPGGQGGKGGIGGPGGAPGDRGCDLCRVAGSGAQGPTGPTGQNGPTGENGAEQPICTRLGKARIGSCESFQ